MVHYSASPEALAAERYGQFLTGKMAQSRLLTEIDGNGNVMYSAPQKITGYEIVESFLEPTVMVTIGGESVFADTLFNISNSK